MIFAVKLFSQARQDILFQMAEIAGSTGRKATRHNEISGEFRRVANSAKNIEAKRPDYEKSSPAVYVFDLLILLYMPIDEGYNHPLSQPADISSGGRS